MASGQTLEAVQAHVEPGATATVVRSVLACLTLHGTEPTGDDRHGWLLLPLSANIGFPLQAIPSSDRHSKAAPGPNTVFDVLFLDLTPESKHFGQTIVDPSDRDFFVSRCDLEPLQPKHVTCVLDFLKEKKKEMAILGRAPVSEEKLELVKTRKRIADSINPEAFRAYVEKLCRRKVAQGDTSFEALELPPPSSPTRAIHAVTATYVFHPSGNGTLARSLCWTSVTEEAHNDGDWVSAPLTAKIAFPLKVVSTATAAEPARRRETPSIRRAEGVRQ